jgi:transposase-like protein
MYKKEKEELAMLVVAGSWIEAMYITTHISETTYHNKEIVQLIENQEKTLKDLLEAIKPYKENTSIKKIIEGLKPIEATYKNLDKDGFNKKQVMKIQNKIGELRNNLIS